MFIKIDHFQLEIEEYLFCSNYLFICISYKGSCCCQTHQVIVNLSLCFVKHIILLTVLRSFMSLITTHWIFQQNWLVWWFSVFWWSYCHSDVTLLEVVFSESNILLRRRCSVYSYLKGIRNIWNIISKKYESLESIKCARKHVLRSFFLKFLKEDLTSKMQ